MISKIIENFIFHQNKIILNPATKETVTAGLGPIEQYIISLFVFFIVLMIWIIKKKKKQ